jgi:hypothetical protein
MRVPLRPTLPKMATVLLACLAAVALAGCATPSNARHKALTLVEAKAIVAAFEARQVPPSSAVVVAPGEAGALEVLKSDRLDAFPAAIAAIASMEARDDAGGDVDVTGVALRAQLHLAWAEAELTVAEVLARTATSLDTTVRALEVRGDQGVEEQQHLERERERIASYRETDEALRLLAAEHVDAGYREADLVIQHAPDNYVGYRVAADAARLRNQWQRFGELLTRVEAHNPDSNGLRFLRGVAAWMRDGDASTAAGFFRSALQHDPAFVRAQAQLVLVAPTIMEQHRELEALKAMSPDHQIVRWAGPGIDVAHTAAVERQALIDAAMGLPTSSSPQPE